MTKVFFRRPQRDYSAIPNEALRDERISMAARGFLALLMSYSDEWVFHLEHLKRVACFSDHTFAKIMKELKEAGYARLERVRLADGTLGGSQWSIFDSPQAAQPNSEIPEIGKHRDPALPGPDKTPPLRRPTVQEDQKGKNPNPHNMTSSPAGFDEFWAVFPRRRGSISVVNAKKAYDLALQSVEAETILEAAKAYANEREYEDEEFTLSPERWLAGAFWDVVS